MVCLLSSAYIHELLRTGIIQGLPPTVVEGILYGLKLFVSNKAQIHAFSPYQLEDMFYLSFFPGMVRLAEIGGNTVFGLQPFMVFILDSIVECHGVYGYLHTGDVLLQTSVNGSWFQVTQLTERDVAHLPFDCSSNSRFAAGSFTADHGIGTGVAVGTAVVNGFGALGQRRTVRDHLTFCFVGRLFFGLVAFAWQQVAVLLTLRTIQVPVDAFGRYVGQRFLTV